MKKVLIIILTGYVAGLLGAATFFYLIKPELLTGKVTREDIPQEILVSNYIEPEIEPEEKIEVNEFVKPDSPALSRLDVLSESFTDASRLSTSSVVYIRTVMEREYSNTFLEWFFGERPSQSFISTGSGVIYTSDGYVVTNNHVIENADAIEVIHEKRTYKAELIGSDPSTDLAILKIDGEDMPNIKIGRSRDLEVGEWVLAVGNPFNLTSTVTAGIVSAKGRQINILRANFPIESFIQTDAAINPGNSGGALVNTKGELVGINTAILSKTGSYAGYGFAVPVDIVSKIVEDLIKYKEVQKAFVGAEVSDIDQQLGEELELDDWNGVIIQNLQKGGAADRGGLREGDIIVSLNDQDVKSKGEYEEVISYHSPGDRMDVTYKRGNKVADTQIILTNVQGTTEIITREIYTSRRLGADFEVVPKVEKDLLKIDDGVRITKIRSGFIKRLGIEEGFIVTHINKVPIKDAETLVDILVKIRGRVYVEGVSKDGVRGYYSYFF
ncbi:MAG: trypsin-like peptidase domain-containing protein [Cyclobacteriaceae bacterium]|jgi:Do/DeqQ family serine protease